MSAAAACVCRTQPDVMWACGVVQSPEIERTSGRRRRRRKITRNRIENEKEKKKKKRYEKEAANIKR